MLRLLSTLPMKRDPNLIWAKFITNDTQVLRQFEIWCLQNKIVHSIEYNAYDAIVTAIPSKEHLSFILLKFGGGSE